MDKNMKYILIAAVIAVVVIVAALALTTQEEPVVYDSIGKVKAQSSDLTFEYKNEESIYGAFNSDYSLDHALYYAEAKIGGKVKIDFNKVKWDEDYVPDNETDMDDNIIVHVNDIAYAEENFTNIVLEDYSSNNVNSTIDVYLQDSKGDSIREFSSYDDDLPLIVKDFKVKDGVGTMKFKYNFHQKVKNEMFNGPDYEGQLLDSRNDDHKISKAKIVFHFYNDQYDFTVTSVLKGDDFTHKHM